MAIESVSCAGFGGDIERVHDAGEQQGFAERRLPTEFAIVGQLGVPGIDAGIRGAGIRGTPVVGEIGQGKIRGEHGGRKKIHERCVSVRRERSEPGLVNGRQKIGLRVEDVGGARLEVDGLLGGEIRSERDEPCQGENK
jgi:hypothetical protein